MDKKKGEKTLQLLKPKDSADPGKWPHGRRTQIAGSDGEDDEEE